MISILRVENPLLILFSVAKYGVQINFYKNRIKRRVYEFLHVRQRFDNVTDFFISMKIFCTESGDIIYRIFVVLI